MATAGSKPFHLRHMRRWLSVQQAVDHLSTLSEEPVTSDDLARLADEHKLDLYWYRPGQQLAFIDNPDWPDTELTQPLRLHPQYSSDQRAIIGILRHHPALPADENDTPTLQDSNGNRLRITFEFSQRPEPFSSRWYPNYAELVVMRRDLERLENQLFSSDEDPSLQPDLLLDVIWQLEQMAMGNDLEDSEESGPERRKKNEEPVHSLDWLTRQLSNRSQLDPALLGKVLNAAERQHQHQHPGQYKHQHHG